MKIQLSNKQVSLRPRHQLSIAPDLSKVSQLTEGDRPEILRFLDQRPVHTVAMTSFILDNGVVSELNRGEFYGFRNSKGELEGVALIGHTTLVEARSQDALTALAITAKSSKTPIHLIMSSGNDAHSFWNQLTDYRQQPSLSFTELLFEVGFPFPVQNCELELRMARKEEVVAIAEAHAEVALIETGMNPMLRDRSGFMSRTMRRIEQDRTFVVFDGDKLVFKVDVISETGKTAYLEGLYVAPEYRGKGIGAKLLSNVCLRLLGRVENVCLLSNVEFKDAHRCFYKAGMRNTDACTTLFV
ncbi:MAG TPA: GNAT family N-acetyltransferase [Pyrinomonadaceae bacterium]|nr:GNAT family N-acetyltransferase [Pyrinomonadaceae bacterium]